MDSHGRRCAPRAVSRRRSFNDEFDRGERRDLDLGGEETTDALGRNGHTKQPRRLYQSARSGLDEGDHECLTTYPTPSRLR
ncbi:hypothetical protein Pd630_LPD14027 (plasmid) [Rhodococcus opacus PD630]|nr:hypothetical protein Pd630_LPD14027 [Rhodococcus opacus PD630]